MFSEWLLSHRAARNPAILNRVGVAKSRIQSVLDRETVAHIRTLEQKISEQGPKGQRVDPHLITLAIADLFQLDRLAVHHHPTTKDRPWFSNIGTSSAIAQERLETLAPLYSLVSDKLSNQIGDALEVATFKALSITRERSPRYHFDGHFFLKQPKNRYGRFERRAAPTFIGPNKTKKPPDFIQYGHDAGAACIECKNFREWLYPTQPYIKWHIQRCLDLKAFPVFIVRRIHYSTLSNLFEPAGIIAHETYYQYFPSDQNVVAAQAQNKRSLGFTDILASEEPHQRTIRFFTSILPKIAPHMAERWNRNKDALADYANDQINLAQLYTAIGSKAGGKWQEREPEDDSWLDFLEDIDPDDLA